MVLDSSVMLAALFEDEDNAEAEELYASLVAGEGQAHAPPLFHYEVGNSIAMAERRNRVNAAAGRKYLQALYDFPVLIDGSQRLPQVMALAYKHMLTAYDAAFLELGLRFRLPLASFDGVLALAAYKEKLPLVFPHVLRH